MDIKTFTDKLTELNWPKKATLSPAVFFEVKELTGAPLWSIASVDGKSELSFRFEVTKVCLAGDVNRPDMADLTEFGVAPPLVIPAEHAGVGAGTNNVTVLTGVAAGTKTGEEKPFVPLVAPVKPPVQ